MDPLSLDTSTFTLKLGTTPVPGTVSLDGTVAGFTPTQPLSAPSLYTATLSTGIRDLAGNALATTKTWQFTTGIPALGPARVNLGAASDFVVLATIGITAGAATTITGNVGLSPGISSAYTGFAPLTLDGTGTFSLSPLVSGKVYASDHAAPTPSNLAVAVSDMKLAYTDAAGRTGSTVLPSAELGTLVLPPGLYSWPGAVSITTDLTLNGASKDVWIFQINGALTMAAAARVNLTGGAQAGNVFWQTVGAVGVGASAQLEGIVLTHAAITLGASVLVNGRLFAETVETLAASVAVVQPGP